MAGIPSGVERFWNAFGLVVCLAAGADGMYWRRNVWEGTLAILLLVFAGRLFGSLIGLNAHAGPEGKDGRQDPA
jgi:hypothetical protein